MRTSARLLKLNARKGLKGYWNPAVFCSAFYICTLLVTSTLVERILGKSVLTATDYLLAFGIGLVLRLLTSLVKAGLLSVHFRIIDKEKPKLSQLFTAFRTQPDRYLFLELILTSADLVYIISLIIGFGTAITTGYVPLLILMLIWFISGGIALIYLHLTLALAIPLFLEDEALSTLEAIKKSAALMKGQRLRLFRLLLSYIGWFVPALTTSGISLFWTVPYLTQTFCLLSREILDQRK